MDVEWDPYRMTEGISDDPVDTAILGMSDLRTATANLMDWVREPGDDYYELETYYLPNLTRPGVSCATAAPTTPTAAASSARTLDQAHYLLHEAESDHWSAPASGNLRVSSNDEPPLHADLHIIGPSDIRPLIRDQLLQLDRTTNYEYRLPLRCCGAPCHHVDGLAAGREELTMPHPAKGTGLSAVRCV
jgi:hypothetical protein